MSTLPGFVASRTMLHAPGVLSLAQGNVHNLLDYYDRCNRRYFSGSIRATIRWGRRRPRGQRQQTHDSIRMGSYCSNRRLIRIHPSLDRRFVPHYFVEWIVYHEMLHQKHTSPVINGRNQFHTPAFYAEEALFDDFLEARLWERTNLHRILVF